MKKFSSNIILNTQTTWNLTRWAKLKRYEKSGNTFIAYTLAEEQVQRFNDVNLRSLKRCSMVKRVQFRECFDDQVLAVSLCSFFSENPQCNNVKKTFRMFMLTSLTNSFSQPLTEYSCMEHFLNKTNPEALKCWGCFGERMSWMSVCRLLLRLPNLMTDVKHTKEEEKRTSYDHIKKIAFIISLTKRKVKEAKRLTKAFRQTIIPHEQCWAFCVSFLFSSYFLSLKRRHFVFISAAIARRPKRISFREDTKRNFTKYSSLLKCFYAVICI